MRRLPWALLLGLLAGCSEPHFDEGMPCGLDDRCPPGMQCAYDGLCYTDPPERPDAAAPDGGAPDASARPMAPTEYGCYGGGGGLGETGTEDSARLRLTVGQGAVGRGRSGTTGTASVEWGLLPSIKVE